jgi:hypothetical protein
MCCSTRFSEKRGLLLIERAVFGDSEQFLAKICHIIRFYAKKVTVSDSTTCEPRYGLQKVNNHLLTERHGLALCSFYLMQVLCTSDRVVEE